MAVAGVENLKQITKERDVKREARAEIVKMMMEGKEFQEIYDAVKDKYGINKRFVHRTISEVRRVIRALSDAGLL